MNRRRVFGGKALKQEDRRDFLVWNCEEDKRIKMIHQI